MSLSRFAVQSPVKVTMIFVAIIILGLISLQRLPTNLFPDIRAPRVTTTIRTTGLSPQEVERRINEPLERQLYTISGVKEVETIARADSAVITTEFTWDTPLDFAFLDVKKVVGDMERQESEDIESATVLRYDPNAAPILTMAIKPSKGLDLITLQRVAKEILRPQFERIEGVASVVISGGLKEQARIELNESLMTYYGLSVGEVRSALESENVSSTGGTISEATISYQLRAEARFRTLEDIEKVVIKRFNGSPLLVGDVANVSYEPAEQKDIVLINGEEGVGMAFYREAESNTVAVAQRIREEMDRIQTDEIDEGNLLPMGTELIVVNDQSIFIRDAIREVRNNALLGAVLASIVLWFFLRSIRTTLIVAIAIPLSIVATFNLMYFQGLSLNLMTLGGLALGSGMLVDNAIVVLENIFRLRQSGDSIEDASINGSRQVFGAILASTLTTIVVFLPIIYVQGVAGLLFREQALTVGYSLAASLIVAVLMIPMLCSVLKIKPGGGFGKDITKDFLSRVYEKILRGALFVRPLILLIAIGLFLLGAYGATQLPQEFLPRTEQQQFRVRLKLPSGTPIDVTEKASERILGSADLVKEAVPVAYARIGDSEGDVDANSEDPDGPNTADLLFAVHNWDRPATPALEANLGNFRTSDLVETIENEVNNIPNAKAQFYLQQGSISELIGSSAAPLTIEISGENVELLSRLAAEIQKRIETISIISNVRTNILEGTPEIRLNLREDFLATTGFTPSQLSNSLRDQIDGIQAGEIRNLDGEDLEILVEVDYPRESMEILNSLTVRAPDGVVYPLRSLAEFELVSGPREIIRRQQRRVAQVSADLEDVRFSEALSAVQENLSTLRLPTGYRISYTGEESERSEAFSKLRFTLLLSILLVYMVMASIFESFLQPFLIMATIPLAGVGVIVAFFLTDQSINVMGLIGVVMLGGIVVNNAIVLLDYVNQVRKDQPQLNPHESLVVGCRARLRPVLITTFTTILGLVPMAIGVGQGAELRQPLAIAVLGGLVSSTFLTLLVIPVCQSYLDSFKGLFRKKA